MGMICDGSSVCRITDCYHGKEHNENWLCKCDCDAAASSHVALCKDVETPSPDDIQTPAIHEELSDDADPLELQETVDYYLKLAKVTHGDERLANLKGAYDLIGKEIDGMGRG